MDFFALLSLGGGLSLFLYGMQTLSAGLARLCGGRVEKRLRRLTGSVGKSVCFGMVVTAVLQSSAAVTAAVVGLVDAGLLGLRQACGVMAGANIGTTATAWLLALAGSQSENAALRLLRPDSLAPLAAMLGVGCLLCGRSRRLQKVGGLCASFAVLLFGLATVQAAAAPLAASPGVRRLLMQLADRPLLGLLAGAVSTAILQSSSASVGLLQALCATRGVPFAAALPLLVGQNIGASLTSLLAGVGRGRLARRASRFPLWFNALGAAVFLPAALLVSARLPAALLPAHPSAAQIAALHTAFNLFTAALLLPALARADNFAHESVRSFI